MMKRKFFLWGLALAGLCLWGVLIYSPSLKAPFMFDDEQFVIRNPAVKRLGDPVLWQDLNYRKRMIAFLTFAMNYRFHGVETSGYHAVNLAIHLGAALSVVWLVLLLCGTPRMRGESVARGAPFLAFLCGWLFVSHPVQTEAVSYISQRFECLAAFFYLVAVCFYLKARAIPLNSAGKTVAFGLSGAFAALGLLTKETVFTFPVVLVLIEWIFFRAGSRGACPARGPSDAWRRWIYIGGACALIGLAVPALFPNFFRLFTEHAKEGISWELYLLTQFRVIVKYFGLLFFPLRQNLDYDFPLSPGLWDGPTLASAFFVLAVLFLGLKLVRRHPLAGFGVLWFFMTLSPSSSFVPLKDVIFEHRLYLPLVGFGVALFSWLFERIRRFRLFALCSAVFILALSFLSFQRNKVWADGVAIWEDATVQSPMKARPHANLGKAFRDRGEYQKAAQRYQKAIALHRGDPRPVSQVYTNLGAVYGKLKQYPDEVTACLKAIKLNPGNAQAYSNLGFAYGAMGDYDNALYYGEQAVNIAPRFDEGWNNLGVTFGRMKRYETAAACFGRALALNPYSIEARTNLRVTADLMNADASVSLPASGKGKTLPEQGAAASFPESV